MKNFVIYAVILSGVTFLYYIVMIFIDLTGFGKKTKKTQESFDVSAVSDAEEASTIVEETEDGRFIERQEKPEGQEDDSSQTDNDSLPEEEGHAGEQDSGSTSYEDTEYDNDGVDDVDGFIQVDDSDAEQEFKIKLDEARRDMYNTEPSYQEDLLSQDFATALSQPLSARMRILRVEVK